MELRTRCKMIPTIQPIILCGGSGTRLWPLSDIKTPKQFIQIGDKGNLLELTLDRVRLILEKCKQRGIKCKDPILIMHKDHQMYHNGNRILYEEYMNDTGVAIARACNVVDDHDIMLVLPSDHYIENVDIFISDIVEGIFNVTDDNIVLYGISATSPETKYGYILPEIKVRFFEKPYEEMAKNLLEKGALWNSGIFASKRDTVYKNLGDLIDWVRTPREGKAPSFDIAVLQKYEKIYAHKCADWGWSDVGTWQSFTAIPEIKHLINKNVIYDKCKNNKVLNYSNHNIVMIGCSDLLVVTNGNNILIMPSNKDHNNNLKEIASRM